MSKVVTRMLGEIARVINGRAYKQEELLNSGKYRVLRVGNFFSNGSWYYSNLELEQDKYCEHGDLLFAWSASFGPKIWDQEKVIYHYHIWKIVEDQKVLDRRYLYYHLLNSVKGMMASTHGSIMLHLTKDFMERLPVHLPGDPKFQARISAVLSSIDKKIDCNNRINTKLEAMAKTLYDYWFVQFDFPDTNGKPYKSSGGKMDYNPTLKREIPAGWLHSTIGKTFKTHLGGTPSREKEDYWTPSEVNWLSSGENPSTFVVDPDERISDLGLKNSPAKLLPRGTVILSIVRHLRASILGIEAATNQSVVGILETSVFKHCFIYPYLVREIPRLMVLRTGAQQPHINKGVLDATPLVVPDKLTLEAYTSLAAPLFLQIKNYHEQNRELTQLRDWLLPMLMNGQVTVA